MSAATDATPYYLITDNQNGRLIHVFLGRDPAADGGPPGSPVSLHLLPWQLRVGMVDGLPTGRPALGQHPSGALVFREFPSVVGLEAAGFVAVASYRICDAWDDYHSPWAPPAATDQLTTRTSIEESA
jgi:hypothetical protein